MERLGPLPPAGADPARPDFTIAVLADAARDAAFALAQTLRDAGLRGDMAFAARSVKSAMRQAGKSGARRALLLGEDELATGRVVINNMDSGEQTSVPLAEAARHMTA